MNRYLRIFATVMLSSHLSGCMTYHVAPPNQALDRKTAISIVDSYVRKSAGTNWKLSPALFRLGADAEGFCHVKFSNFGESGRLCSHQYKDITDVQAGFVLGPGILFCGIIEPVMSKLVFVDGKENESMSALGTGYPFPVWPFLSHVKEGNQAARALDYLRQHPSSDK